MTDAPGGVSEKEPEKKQAFGKNGVPTPKGPGRKPGVPNKATTLAREAIARFVDGNADRLQTWLDQIADEEGPKEAFKCFMDVVEYHVPKLARTEVTGKDGEQLTVTYSEMTDEQKIEAARKIAFLLTGAVRGE
jgi:hypothetical protein